MFLGEYHPNITDGNRLALPKSVRDKIKGKSLVLAKGFEKCIFGYEEKAWKKEAEKGLSDPISDLRARKLRRYMYSGASEVKLDAQGRFVVPQALKDYASIEEGVIVAGAGDHFEIWDADSWKRHLSLLEKEVLND